MRRAVLSLIITLVAASCLHSSPANSQTNNKTSKEKLVVVKTINKQQLAKDLEIKKMLGTVTARDISQWSKVNICEMGGGNWNYQGPLYSGGLGIMNSSWVAAGGRIFGPTAGSATVKEQIYIAKKIQKGYSVPDQNGCGRGW